MRLIKSLIIVIPSLLFVSALYAGEPLKKAVLVLDEKNIAAYPKNFRTTSDTLPTYPDKNETGFADLHEAGSAQFSQRALEKVVEKLHAEKLIVIDLRQESHGFLNGNAISWFAPKNAGNKGKTDKQIEARQSVLLDSIKSEPSVTVYKILTRNQDDEITSTQPIEYAVHSVDSEQELASKLHLSYARIYVQDHHAPSVKEVNRFVELVRNLPKDTWLYIHCRGGAGRTTSFMAMYDMMKNAKEVSFEEIMQRQIAIGGKDVMKLPSNDSPRYPSAEERLAFLKKFYEYAKNNQDGFETPF